MGVIVVVVAPALGRRFGGRAPLQQSSEASGGEHASSRPRTRLWCSATRAERSCWSWPPSSPANRASSTSRWARVALSKCRLPAAVSVTTSRRRSAGSRSRETKPSASSGLSSVGRGQWFESTIAHSKKRPICRIKPKNRKRSRLTSGLFYTSSTPTWFSGRAWPVVNCTLFSVGY